MNKDLAQRAIDEAFVAHIHTLFGMMATAYSEAGADEALIRFQRGFGMALSAHTAASKAFGNGSPQT